ncbi:hypothetical protein BCR43DRAFT_484480 [Syncephalastrum racemosum]|uniref:Uncharacterized protein n=1 Tax=Syncephalastrum racemosum TaxID=13706 RepID=A0A1X2HKL3_SYNRA|nr:hypothetical protein BCR43DRAFT_484480 [Syncephalastrum racemosum]
MTIKKHPPPSPITMHFTISKIPDNCSPVSIHSAIPSTVSTFVIQHQQQQQVMQVRTSSYDLDAPLAHGEYVIRTLVVSAESPLYRHFRNQSAQHECLTFKHLEHPVGVVVKSNNPSVKIGALVDGICASEEYVKLIHPVVVRQQEQYHIQRKQQCLQQDCYSQARYVKVLECNEHREQHCHNRYLHSKQECVVIGDKAIQSGTATYQVDILGKAGLTAYIGLSSSGKLASGETLYVSVATGAFCNADRRILGVHVVDPFNEREHILQLDGRVENGIHQSVDSLLSNRCANGRMIVCGIISNYNESKTSEEARNLLQTIIHRLRQEGFVVLDSPVLDTEFQKKATQRLLEGKIRTKSTVVVSMEEIPATLLDALQNTSIGREIFQKAKL